MNDSFRGAGVTGTRGEKNRMDRWNKALTSDVFLTRLSASSYSLAHLPRPTGRGAPTLPTGRTVRSDHGDAVAPNPPGRSGLLGHDAEARRTDLRGARQRDREAGHGRPGIAELASGRRVGMNAVPADLSRTAAQRQALTTRLTHSPPARIESGTAAFPHAPRY